VAIHQTRYTLAVILREMPEELVRELESSGYSRESVEGIVQAVSRYLDQQADHQ